MKTVSLKRYMKKTGMTAEEAFEDIAEDALLLSKKLVSERKRLNLLLPFCRDNFVLNTEEKIVCRFCDAPVSLGKNGKPDVAKHYATCPILERKKL